MAVEIHLQAYDYDAGEFKDVAIDPTTKAIKVKDITEAPTDHGELTGLADDDHTQYYNAARHTKAIHDALAIDHGSLFGRGDDDHAQYLNTTRHDITTRHPVANIRKATGSWSGSVGTGGSNITMHRYSLFPSIGSSGGSYNLQNQMANYSDRLGRFLARTDSGSTTGYIYWDYLY